MGYKELTKTGIDFIMSKTKSNDKSLLKGKQTYALPNSNNPASTIYTANPTLNGQPIETNFQLGQALIQWFNFYSKLYSLDANIIAAQAYIESNYRLWAYSSSGAQGISQFLSGALYDVAIGEFGIASHVSIRFTDDEKNKLTTNISKPNQQNAYTYGNNNPILNIAKTNKPLFFQNIMDNPDLVIKAQCRYMSALGTKAANNAASSLFGYNRGGGHVKSTFTNTVKYAENSLNNNQYDEGINYVKKIFKLLSTGFGYNIDFTFDSFKADVSSSNIDIDNIDRSAKLSPSYTLGDLLHTDQGILNIPTKSEISNLTALANKVLQRITDEIIDGEKLIINSAFRNSQLNSIVGGVVTSQHQSAQASDVRVSAKGKDLWTVYKEIISHVNPSKGKIPYDQIIYETKGEDIEQTWIHISYQNNGDNNGDQLIATLVGTSMIYNNYIIGQDKPTV